MHERITTALHTIAQDEDVRILYACESGSRAWGFPSRDSDYDVRFIYVRRPEWYLSINLEHQRDVIERPISEQLDLSGWDLRKALQLLRKSNPPLLEWLNSPIVYFETADIVERLRALLPVYYSPVACLFHYLHMARGNYRDYLQGEIVWIKKYFYVLRPLLAIQWIEAGRGVVPVEFQVLVDTLVQDEALRQAIDQLLERKRAGEELDREPMIPAISAFIVSELARLETASIDHRRSGADIEQLNQLFRTVLTSVW
ncbi:MAG: nucleotidyltransferase domain-containing protein [Chloroflexaceae bacterium]